MDIPKFSSFEGFCEVIRMLGFSMGGGNPDGICTFFSNAEPNIKWHTQDRETDPWEWRIRVLEEFDDISYGKLFFNKSGYITRKWAPYFLAVRREFDGEVTPFDEVYGNGEISHMEKRIYDAISQSEITKLGGAIPIHDIKRIVGVPKEEKSKFDSSMTKLQMNLFISMCGRSQKVSASGETFGWSSTAFCTTEQFWGSDVFEQAATITKQEAIDKITEHIYEINPDAQKNKIKKFILY